MKNPLKVYAYYEVCISYFFIYYFVLSHSVCYRELCCVKKKALDSRKIIVVGDNNHEAEV